MRSSEIPRTPSPAGGAICRSACRLISNQKQTTSWKRHHYGLAYYLPALPAVPAGRSRSRRGESPWSWAPVVRVRDPGHWLLREAVHGPCSVCARRISKLITAVSKVHIDKTRWQCGPWAVCGLCVWYMAEVYGRYGPSIPAGGGWCMTDDS